MSNDPTAGMPGVDGTGAKYVTFALGKEEFGLEILQVRGLSE